MTRIKISAAILTALIGISIFTSVWINRKCRVLIECMERMEQELEEGVSVEETACELEKKWMSFRQSASVMIRNDKLSEPERTAARITILAEQQSPDLMSTIEELRHMTNQLMHSETPHLTSIF